MKITVSVHIGSSIYQKDITIYDNSGVIEDIENLIKTSLTVVSKEIAELYEKVSK